MVNGEEEAVDGAGTDQDGGAPASAAKKPISQAELGRMLGISPATVTKHKAAGMPVDSLESALEWRRTHLNIGQRKTEGETAAAGEEPWEGAPEDHDAARTRLRIAEANLAELRVAELRGDLISVTAVRAAWAGFAAAARGLAAQFAPRLAPLVAAESDQHKCRDLIDREVDRLLVHLANAEFPREADNDEEDPHAGGVDVS
mgnify:CR=1 FL=1